MSSLTDSVFKEADSKEHKPYEIDELVIHERSLLSTHGSTASKPISTDCSAQFHAYHKSGSRPLNILLWVVMHDTEGGTARSIASYFTQKKSGGSAHLVVDDNDCYRTLKNTDIPWGAPGANVRGFHIEQCGYAHWTKLIWSNKHRKTLMRAAYKAAYHCRLFKLPPTFVTAPGLKSHKKGITTHAECTKAFGGSHTDPGPGWPRALFMTMVKSYYLGMRKVKPIV